MLLVTALLVAACGSGHEVTPGAAVPPASPSESANSPRGATLTEDQFWTLVEQARQAGEGDPEAMAEELRGRLSSLRAEEVADFHRLLVTANHRLYTERHAAVAARLCGGYLGDDGFTDYRTWVITRGRAAFDAAVTNPQQLRSLPDAEQGCEGAELFGTVAYALYAEAAGEPAAESLPLLEPDYPPTR